MVAELMAVYRSTIERNIEMGVNAHDLAVLIDEQTNYTMTDDQAKQLEVKLGSLVNAHQREQALAKQEYDDMMREQCAYYSRSRGLN